MAGGLPHPVLISTLLQMDEITIGGQVLEFKHVFYSWMAMAILFIAAIIVRCKLTMVPGKMQNFFETIVGTLENFIIETMGEDGRRFVPFLSALFLYILTMNLLGLIPGCDAPTANINTNVGMAVFVFLLYQGVGLARWKHHYIHHFMGPSIYLCWLMIPLELVSHLSRPLSLTLRLFGNIRGEEIVIILCFAMAPIFTSLPIYALFLLGKCMQAFVFFMLAMAYLKGALEEAH